MERELCSLPNGLDDTYDRIIKQINRKTRALQTVAQRAFLWMIHSSEDQFDRKAMRLAVSFDENCKTRKHLEEKCYDEEVIIEACAGLLIMENDHFRLIHHSVFEYFINPPDRMLTGQYSKYFFTSESAYSRLAKDCLSLMLLDDTDESNINYELRLAWYDLFSHVAKSFDEYLQLSGEIPEDMQIQLNDILSRGDLCEDILERRNLVCRKYRVDNASALVVSTRLYELPILHSNHEIWKSRNIPPDALHLAAFGGSLVGVRWLLDLGQDVNGIDENGNTPLMCAAVQGHLEIAKCLMAMGADVNTETEEGINALCKASRKGHLEVVKYLIQVGANVNVSGVQSKPALQAACLADSSGLEIVKHLVEKGADVTAQGGEYGSALQAASYRENLEIVKYLIENGADVTAQGGEYGSALQAASYRENLEIVKYLIENGADVNAQGGEYGSALQAASYGGNLEIVKLLINEGVDVNAEGEYYEKAITAAASRGRTKIVDYLTRMRAQRKSDRESIEEGKSQAALYSEE